MLFLCYYSGSKFQGSQFNPDYAVDIYCDLKNHAVPTCRDSTILFLKNLLLCIRHKSLQFLVSLKFFNPRKDDYYIIWVKDGSV